MGSTLLSAATIASFSTCLMQQLPIGSPEFLSICSESIQNYGGAGKMNIQLNVKVLVITEPLDHEIVNQATPRELQSEDHCCLSCWFQTSKVYGGAGLESCKLLH